VPTVEDSNTPSRLPGGPRTLISRLVARVRAWHSPFAWRFRWRHGLIDTPHDRYLLEAVIFPTLRARADVRRILFVGCEFYTAHYAEFFSGREFITMDSDPAKQRYGATHHVVDTFANVGAHFGPASLDVVICNGVIGWGLDRVEEIDRAATGCFDCLKPGGVFIVGWNDTPPWRPTPLEELVGFRRFAPIVLEPFSGTVYRTHGPQSHVYSFYTRPESEHD
jgi:SAM-dependent methyltransferase